jgi:multidrug resistance efflux pump
MSAADVSTALDLVVLAGIGGLWFRLGAVLQGQQDNRRRMADIETRLAQVEREVIQIAPQVAR